VQDAQLKIFYQKLEIIPNQAVVHQFGFAVPKKNFAKIAADHIARCEFSFYNAKRCLGVITGLRSIPEAPQFALKSFRSKGEAESKPT